MKAIQLIGGRARHLGRRHQTGAQLAHNLLADLGVVGADVRDVQLVEHQIADLRPLVVAADAVFVEHGAARSSVHGRRGGSIRCGGAREQGGGQETRGLKTDKDGQRSFQINLRRAH